MVVSESARRVLIFAPAYYPAVKAGGPARSLGNLVSELEGDYWVDVVTPDRDLGDSVPFQGLDNAVAVSGSTRIHYVNMGSPVRLAMKYRELSHTHYDLLLLNSAWNVQLSLLPAALRSFRYLKADSVLLMPRGGLEPGALSLKRWKKSAAMPIFKAIFAKSVDYLGPTSDAEAQNAAAWMRSKPLILSSPRPDLIPFEAAVPSQEVVRLVFVGRIHPTKGLLELLKALALVKHPTVLSIYGPVGDEGYWDRCQSQLERLPGWIVASYLGVAGREDIPRILHDHDAFVSLTAGENFSHSIAEALQAGCSVITTDKTPWTGTLRAGGGWVVQDRSVREDVARVLEDVLSMTPGGRRAQRLRARRAFDEWERQRGSNPVDQVLQLKDKQEQ